MLTIFIIRHGEKPLETWPGPGLTPDGTEDPQSLVIRGWQRSGAWSALFGTGGASDYLRPTSIYAMDPKSQAGDDPSQRPFETITPLAARLSLTPVTTFALGQEADLVKEIIGCTGVVLLCWEHKAIVRAILPAMGGEQPIPGSPTKWNGSRFDVVLRLDRGTPASPWSLRQLFPCLLSCDSTDPLS